MDYFWSWHVSFTQVQYESEILTRLIYTTKSASACDCRMDVLLEDVRSEDGSESSGVPTLVL